MNAKTQKRIVDFIIHVLPYLAFFTFLIHQIFGEIILRRIFGEEAHLFWWLVIIDIIMYAALLSSGVFVNEVDQNTCGVLKGFFSGKRIPQWPGFNFKGLLQIHWKIVETLKDHAFKGSGDWECENDTLYGKWKGVLWPDSKSENRDENMVKWTSTTLENIQERMDIAANKSLTAHCLDKDELWARQNKNLAISCDTFNNIANDCGTVVKEAECIDLDNSPEFRETKQNAKKMDFFNQMVEKLMKSSNPPENAEEARRIARQILSGDGSYKEINLSGNKPGGTMLNLDT